MGVITTGHWPKALEGKTVRKSKKAKEAGPKPNVKGRDANLAVKGQKREMKKDRKRKGGY